MRAIDLPGKVPSIFAKSAGAGYTRPIPLTSQIGIIDGAASYPDGFPPKNFQAAIAGGVPPFGQDVNGILSALSGMALWYSASGPILYDAAFQATIGGYPQGTILASATFGNFWLSTADNNTTDPDTGGAGWFGFSLLPLSQNITGNAATATTATTAGAISGFVSAETTIGVAGTNTTVAHGLAVVPKSVVVVVRCKTAEFGFSVGDEVAINMGSYSPGIGIYSDAVNVGIILVSGGSVGITRKDTFVEASITMSNWKYVIRAWK